jgi:hypothetical protein
MSSGGNWDFYYIWWADLIEYYQKAMGPWHMSMVTYGLGYSFSGVSSHSGGVWDIPLDTPGFQYWIISQCSFFHLHSTNNGVLGHSTCVVLTSPIWWDIPPIDIHTCWPTLLGTKVMWDILLTSTWLQGYPKSTWGISQSLWGSFSTWLIELVGS